MSCDRCERPKTWSGDDRRCAFDAEGRFVSDNWNCGSLDWFRTTAAEELFDVEDNDQHAATLPLGDGLFVVLGWYKSRGRTEAAALLYEGHLQPLTLAAVEALLAEVEA